MTCRELPTNLHIAHGAMRRRITVQCDNRGKAPCTLIALQKNALAAVTSRLVLSRKSTVFPSTTARTNRPTCRGSSRRSSRRATTPYRPRELVPATLNGNIMVHPPHDRGVGNQQAALGHHLHQIPEAELEAVPPSRSKTMISRSKCRPQTACSRSLAIAPSSTHQRLRSYNDQQFAPEPPDAPADAGEAGVQESAPAALSGGASEDVGRQLRTNCS